MSAAVAFEAVAGQLLAEGDVDEAHVFNSPGLATRGKNFAILSRGEQVLKLPAARCDELIAAGVATRFESGNRPLREWVRVGPEHSASWLELAREARAFARGEAPDAVRRTIVIDAPRQAVYDALVQPEGLRGWWSAGAEVSTSVGGLTRFVWSEEDHTTFRVDRLVEPSEVAWTCVAQQDRNLPRPDEWVGTSVTFRLSEADGDRTRLDFAHRGLAELECGDMCSGGWDFFLRRSLKPLVESGRGLPWQP